MSLDDEIANLEEKENRDRAREEPQVQESKRVSIGTVEHFFDKVSVAAITLTGNLRVGDTIEIEGNGETIRQRIDSMQIDRRDVDEAGNGDSVGIKVERRISRGSLVYRIM